MFDLLLFAQKRFMWEEVLFYSKFQINVDKYIQKLYIIKHIKPTK